MIYVFKNEGVHADNPLVLRSYWTEVHQSPDLYRPLRARTHQIEILSKLSF